MCKLKNIKSYTCLSKSSFPIIMHIRLAIQNVVHYILLMLYLGIGAGFGGGGEGLELTMQN